MITIKGIRLKDISITKDSDGALKLSGNYELLSNADKVLAKQDFGGYNSLKLEQTPETAKKIHEVMLEIKTNLEIQLGLVEENG